ncbi:MAG: amidohydrolase family protein [Phycisphaerae bacterium]|nr:amidohydrolase family protein [Gemmatimonadaceae bacterium]
MPFNKQLQQPALLTGAMVCFGVLATASAQTAPVPRQEIPAQGTFAFVNVNVLTMENERVLPNQTVVVRGGKIVAMGASSSVAVPADAQRMAGQGKYLMPGLAEMHGHMPTTENALLHNTLMLYVANGITTVRGMQGGAYHLQLRDQLNKGELLGPRFYPAGPQLSANSAPTPEAGRLAVQRQKEQGFDLLKIQEGLAPGVYDTIVATAKALRIPFAGHIPDEVGLWRALDAGQVTIDHLDNYMETVQAADFPADRLALVSAASFPDPVKRRIAAVAAATKRAGVAVVPTMPLWEILYVPPDSVGLGPRPDLAYWPRNHVQTWYNQLKEPRIPREQYDAWKTMRNNILQALNDAGVTILLGTDSPQRMSVPGFSIHNEMKSMVVAGMTPYQVLRSGTWNVASFMGLLAESGTVAIGKRADLLLLDANPLENVANVQKRVGVMVNGRWLPEAEIQARLRKIADGYR